MMRQSSESCIGLVVVCPTSFPMQRLSASLSGASRRLLVDYSKLGREDIPNFGGKVAILTHLERSLEHRCTPGNTGLPSFENTGLSAI
jgi:hypothetical protein